jgi:phosphatidylserine/phosphatidylglycerophosphate/cardiolipin synthase-like enzyme
MKKKSTKRSPLKIKNPKRYVLGTLLSFILAFSLWVQEPSQETRLPETGTPVELYANQVKDDLTATYSTAIESAQRSILLVIYSLTDPDIIACLRQKSLNGVDVRVICDAKASPNILQKLGPKVNLTRRFGPGLMHQKILVVDDTYTWLGSANMTTESLRMHGNLVAAFESPQIAQHILAKAATMREEGRDESFPHREFSIGNQSIELWFLPDDKTAVKRLQKLISSAKKTIRIAMFTWTRKDLAQSVIDASKRGVHTEVVIDQYQGKGAGSKIVELLKTNGIQVSLSRGGPLLHHKFLYIDDDILVNGSANWTRAAFTQNDDCFMVIHHLNDRQKAQMDQLWRIISTECEAVK